jgi:hypothetical protein
MEEHYHRLVGSVHLAKDVGQGNLKSELCHPDANTAGVNGQPLTVRTVLSPR